MTTAAPGADEAYSRFSALGRLLSATRDPARSGTLYPLVLRAALHPFLRPHLSDPLLPLPGGDYVSLDASASAVAEAAAREFGGYPFALLSAEDRSALAPLLRDVPTSDLTVEAQGASRAIGAVWGGLYVPALGMAVPCRVCAAYDRRAAGDPLDGWPEPIPVRPVAEAVAASAGQALRAAAALLCREGLLPPGLTPAPVYFDVCAPDLPETAFSGISGDSLGLPFALAFLSALCGVPLPSDLAATGALAADACTVSEVGWLPEKFAAVQRVLRPSSVTSPDSAFLAPTATFHPFTPEEKAAVLAVPDLRAAATSALPGLFKTISSSSSSSPGRLHDEPYAFVCALPPDVADTTGLGEDRDCIVRDCLRRAGGKLFARSGDGAAVALCASFAEPVAAVNAALAAAQALICHGWPSDSAALAELLPAFAVHSGPRDGDAPEQTERIAEVGTPGRVLVSASIREALAAGTTAAAPRVTPLGTHRLRDLRPPVALFEVAVADAPTHSRPTHSRPTHSRPALSATLTARSHNLPVQALPLFGRDAERASLRRLLLDPATRLVTLTGPGGCGKTRLALEAGAASADGFEGGVYLVPLGEARSGEDAAGAIAAALRLSPSPGQRSASALALAALGGPRPRILLILDGAEGAAPSDDTAALPGIAAFITDLLRAAPGVVCLATARTPLSVPAASEAIFPVPPLGAPPAALPADEAEIAQAVRLSAAGRLFLARARHVHPGFTIADRDGWRALAGVCRRFAAAPLSLMLIASQMSALPLPEVASRLEKGAAATGTAAVHSLITEAIEAALALSSPAERDLLTRLSYFAGGFTSSAAEAIASASQTTGVIELLALLEEKGLLQREKGISVGASRFYLPPPVREFARTVLLSDKDAEESVRKAHARYYEALAVQTGAMADTERETAAFDLLEQEMDNLRITLDYLRVAGPERVPSFVFHLADFLYYRGRLREWLDWPRFAVRLMEKKQFPVQTHVRSHLHWCCASACLNIGDRDGGEPHLDAALSLALENEDRKATADARFLRGAYHAHAGRLPEAEDEYLQALALYRGLGRVQGEVASLNGLGLLALRRGDLDTACDRHRQVASLCRRIDDRRGLAVAVNNLGYVAALRQDYGEAARQFGVTHELCRELRDIRGTATALLNLGEARLHMAQPEAAATTLALAEALLRALQEPDDSAAMDGARPLLEKAATAYGEERFAALRRELARHPLGVLLGMDPEDPLAPALRRLRLDTVRLTV
jgi:predicted ATPase